MTAPTPAAVRAAMNDDGTKCTDEEREAFSANGGTSRSILRDHIRAVAGEMRFHAVRAEAVASAVSKSGAEILHNYANDLRVFADKLEGLK